jgi:hypothetical protein
MLRRISFLAVAVVVLFGAYAAVQIGRPYLDTVRGLSPSSPRTPEGDYGELVQRILGTPYSGPDGALQSQTVDLYPAAMPPSAIADVPLPAQARLVGSVVRNRGGKAASVDVVLDAQGSQSDVASSYERDLAARGWTPPANQKMAPQPGGFVPSSVTTYRMYCRSQDGPWMNVSYFASAGAPLDMRIHVELSAAPMQGYGPCNPPPPGGPGPMPNRLPALGAPDGVSLRPTGGGGSNDRQESSAIATGSTSVAALESFFADQLLAAGWTRGERGAQGPIAWSTWKVPGSGDWQGFLLVRDLGSDRHALSVVAESPTGSSGSMYWKSGP